VLLRDHAIGDMVQLRLAPRQRLGDCWYRLQV
jgi:hypothetical protein